MREGLPSWLTPVATDLVARGVLDDAATSAADDAGLGVVTVIGDGDVRWSDEAYRLHGRPRWRRVHTVEDALRGVASESVAEVRALYAALGVDAAADVRYRVVGETGQTLDLVLRGVDQGIAVVHRASLDATLDRPVAAPALGTAAPRPPRLLLDTGVAGVARSVETVEPLDPTPSAPAEPGGPPSALVPLGLPAEVEMASAVLNATPDLVLVYDVVTRRTTRIVGDGESDHELVAHLSSSDGPRIEVHPEDVTSLERWRDNLARLEPGEVSMTEARFRIDHAWRWRELRASEFHRAQDGRLTEAVVVVRDVHDRVEAALRVTEREKAFREVFDSSPVALAVLDDAGRFSSVNDAFCKLVERTRDNVMTTVYEALVHHEDRAGAVVSRSRRAGDPAHTLSTEHRILRSGGSVAWVRARTSDIDVDDRALSLMSLEDITASKAREDQLRYDALHDALTGLPNRRLLHDRLSRALSRSRRTGARLAVFFLDLDDLKRVNDTHPWQHKAGDLLITSIAVAVRDALRDTDTLARYGGDEFVAVCEDVGDDTALAELGQRLLEAVREPLTIGGETVHATVSIGLAVPDTDNETLEDLLARADGAMFRAKAAGGARIVRADRQPTTRDEDDLVGALERGELRQLYRPVVSLSTGALLGMRAALRWRHPHLGTMSSQEMRQALEAGTAAMPIVHWSMERAVDDVRTVAPDRVEHLSVWVTIPGRAAVASSTQEALARAFAGPDGSQKPDTAPSLVLEVNEHDLASMGRRPALRRHLHDLTAVGPVALGVENLTADTLPVGALQLLGTASVCLDPELLAAADENASTEELVRALVAAAAALGVITIATRVEAHADLDRARHLGIHAVQGDLIGPAAMLEAYADLVHGSRLVLDGPLDHDDLVEAAMTPPDAEPVHATDAAPQERHGARRTLRLVIAALESDDEALEGPGAEDHSTDELGARDELQGGEVTIVLPAGPEPAWPASHPAGAESPRPDDDGSDLAEQLARELGFELPPEMH